MKLLNLLMLLAIPCGGVEVVSTMAVGPLRATMLYKGKLYDRAVTVSWEGNSFGVYEVFMLEEEWNQWTRLGRVTNGVAARRLYWNTESRLGQADRCYKVERLP